MSAIKTQSVPALQRGLAILECLSHSHHGLTLSQITRNLELPKSTVHCLLLTLERLGYIARDEQSGRYRLGLRLFGLANTALAGMALREQAAPVLRSLMAQTKLTVHLAAMEQDQAVLIARIDPPGVPRPATWVGKRMPLHCTALGKALLAYLPEGQVEQLIRNQGMLRYNENTISSLRRLKQELQTVRRNGYSIDDEEEEIGVRCVGAPVLDSQECARAAVSVTGTISNIDSESLPRQVAAVQEAAHLIAATLGSRPAAAVAPRAAAAASAAGRG
jgi:DNA-binding IclR family transcriptional regulator